MPIQPELPRPPYEDFGLLHRAYMLAQKAHYRQFDKSGEPYMWHLLRVGMSLLPDVKAAATGLLHDILEDTLTSRETIVDAVRPYGECYEAVLALTRKDGELYPDYINRVAKNPLAVKVKVADLFDNLSSARLAKLSAAERHRLEAKYLPALSFLTHQPFKGEFHETHLTTAASSRMPAVLWAEPASICFEHFIAALGGEASSGYCPTEQCWQADTPAAFRAAGPYPNRVAEGQAGEPATKSLPAPAAADGAPE